MKRIAVCVPTYNESDIIETTVKKIDNGLQYYDSTYETYIVNCDNSIDETGKIFQNLKTRSKKIYIKSDEIGKGINLINFFEFCKEKSIDYAITLDADVISMKDNWINEFLDKLINENVNYVVPSYKRSRFEGSTTNQFAYPLLYALTGKKIRQPIGGDFAFDKSYIDYIVKQPFNDAIKKYGIDIFMTLNAVYGNFTITSIEFDKKIHKPSFGKMYNMFGQVLNGAIYTIRSQKNIILNNKEKDNYPQNINLIRSRKFVHKKKANELLQTSYEKLNRKDTDCINIFGYTGGKIINDKEWENIMYNLINKTIKDKNIKDIEFESFVDIFIIRAVSYWNRVQRISAIDAEKIITKIAENLRRQVLKKEEVKYVDN